RGHSVPLFPDSFYKRALMTVRYAVAPTGALLTGLLAALGPGPRRKRGGAMLTLLRVHFHLMLFVSASRPIVQLGPGRPGPSRQPVGRKPAGRVVAALRPAPNPASFSGL